MFDQEDTPQRAPVSRARVMANLLGWAAGAVVVAAILSVFAQVLIAQQTASVTPSTILIALAVLLSGVVLAVLLCALAELLRRFDSLPDAIRATQRPAASEEVPAPPPLSPVGVPATPEMIALLREIRDIVMLDEGQRSRRLEVQGRALVADLEVRVPQLLQEHRWREARQLVQEGRVRFPSFTQLETLLKSIEEKRAQVENKDIEAAERQVEELAALKAWKGAADVVRELLERHPDSERARALALRVRKQYQMSLAEQRERLQALAQDAVNRREWAVALQHATTLVQQFPNSPEAEALRLQLPQLQENAEIQSRKRMETQIHELVRQRRFDLALRIANDVIDRFPQSPQAEALRGQLPKLRERAAPLTNY
jgi:hypothetical protein